MIIQYAILLVLLFLAHTIADFVTQNKYHLGKFNKTGWILPLFSHAKDHSLFTLGAFILWIMIYGHYTNIMLFIVAFGLSIVNLVVHFIVDRIKAHPSIFPKFPYPTRMYWVLLGFDQYAHIVTTIVIGVIFMTYV